MKTKKIKLSRQNLAFIAIVLVTVTFCAAALYFLRKPSPPLFSGSVEPLSIGIVEEYSSLSIIAQEKDFFAANGLEVTLKSYEAGPAAVADVLTGKIDTATAADFVAVRNSFNNEDLKIIASQAVTDSFFLVVRQDHGITSPGDLKGKRIGVTRKTAGEFYLGQYVTLNHFSLNEIVIVDLPPAGLVNALIAGNLDAIVTFNPNISHAQASLGSKAKVWSLQGDQQLHVLLYATGTTTTQRPEVIRRYLNALLQAEQYIVMHDSEARQIVGKYLHHDDAYMQTVWQNIRFSLALDQDLLISMDDQARWAIENKLTSATSPPDYLEFMYFDGLEAVKPDGITVIR